MGDKYALEPGVRAILTGMGLSPTAVLRRARLRPDLLSGGPVWLGQEEFFSLWKAIEDEADHPNLPLLILSSSSPELFAAPLFASLMSPDLNTAARRLATYKRLIGPLHLTVDVGARQTAISVEWPTGAEPPATLILTELVFWVELARLATRTPVEPVRLAVRVPPVDLDAYRQALGVDIEQSNELVVSFSAADAAQPFVTANEAIWDTFEPDLRRRLADLDVGAPTSAQVRAVLLEMLPVGRTTVADTASELAVSARTLHRQLHAEGVSFQRILDATREDLARHYLRDPAMSAAEIAFLLGYAETTSFYRAFQKWTGITPERARSSMSASP